MIDIKILRNEPEKLIKALERRKETRVDIDGLLALDKERREILYNVEQMKNKQNSVSKQIPVFKKEGKFLKVTQTRTMLKSENSLNQLNLTLNQRLIGI